MSIGANWGATEQEQELELPCDRLLEAPGTRCHRAISIDASPAETYRWLCQLRRAPYSYDLLDNFGKRSPRSLTPGLDQLAPAQRFMRIFALASFDPGEQITLLTDSGNTAVTYAVRAEGEGSRLLVRILLASSSRQRALLGPPLVLGDLVMMRKQLLTLRDLAEAG